MFNPPEYHSQHNKNSITQMTATALSKRFLKHGVTSATKKGLTIADLFPSNYL
jgi:hypothetical protein